MNQQSEKSSSTTMKTKETGQQLHRVSPTQVLSPFEEMDRAFNRLFPSVGSWPMRLELPSWGELAAFDTKLPRVDVIERDGEIAVKAEVPGVRKEDLDVSVSDNTITIKGHTKHEEKEEEGDYYRCEISRGEFARTLALPANVDSSKVKATFKDGVLDVVMPKLEKSKRHTITVD